jgi:chorismate mutase/prephenate dehydratase
MNEYFAGKRIEETFFDQFEDVIQAVAERRVHYGVVPIENSSTGGISEVYDLIRRYDCAIVGEKCIKIEHHLLALPDTQLDDVRIVYSHPQGFSQCRQFFKEHRNWVREPYFSTSKSAERVQKEGRNDAAAVANGMAASMYGLKILVPDICTNKHNYTRFFVVSAAMEEQADVDKITLVLSTKHEPGALYHVLGHFFYVGMNMTHLESRPMEGHPFDYFFHIDLTGSLHDPGIVKTLDDLAKTCIYFKILGNYKADQEGAEDAIRTHREDAEA